MLRRRGALSAWGITFALLFVACACSSGGSGKPVAGGTMRVSVRDLGSLDPPTTTGRGGTLAISALFDSLTQIDPETGEPAPAAASKWTTSPDGKTWTFTIAPATFHDGTPVTAQDFKAAFDRISLKSTGSEIAFQLEAVNGFNAAKVQGTAKTLAGVTAVDASTLKIVLDRPFAELPAFLAHPSLGPLAKAMAAKPALLQTQPIGNGPFKMAGARTNERVELVRFESHAGSTAYLDRLELDLQGDPAQAWRDFLNKRVDVAEVPVEAIASAGGRAGQGGFTPYWAALYYGPNLRSAKFSKPAARKAISIAIDRKKIAEEVYGGTKEAATGFIPRGVRGYAPGACGYCVTDADKARELFKLAYGGHPPAMTIDHLDDPIQKALASSVAEDLKNVGISASLREHKSKDFLKFLQSGAHEIAVYGWFTEVSSPDGFLAQQLRTGSPNNHTGLADRALDALIDQARATQDETQRMEAYRKAEQKALDIMALIPIVFFRNHIGVAPRVHGLKIDGAGLFDAASVWVKGS
jgi:oligopeptide transport system substrate-binding protein